MKAANLNATMQTPYTTRYGSTTQRRYRSSEIGVKGIVKSIVEGISQTKVDPKTRGLGLGVVVAILIVCGVALTGLMLYWTVYSLIATTIAQYVGFTAF